MIIWTYFTRAFTMGGRVDRPVGCKVVVGQKLDLGKGFFGYEVKSPNGITVIVEEKSGAIVGNNLQEVRNDIATSEMAVMESQVRHAVEELKQVEVINETDFWGVYERSN